MSIEYKNNTAKLVDLISIEDVESLFNWLAERKKPKVDLGELDHMHTAVLQLLLVFKPTITDLPNNDLKIFLTGGKEK
jgi:hypothetical protein